MNFLTPPSPQKPADFSFANYWTDPSRSVTKLSISHLATRNVTSTNMKQEQDDTRLFSFDIKDENE